MKNRISATVDPKTERLIESIMKNSPYRNKSHVIEDAIKLLWEKINDKDKK